MKISINGKFLHKVSMSFYDAGNSFLSYPEHRIELIETSPQLIIGVPEKLVIQLFLDNIISVEQINLVKIKIGKEKIRKCRFLNAKFQYSSYGFSKKEHVRLYFQDLKLDKLSGNE